MKKPLLASLRRVLLPVAAGLAALILPGSAHAANTLRWAAPTLSNPIYLTAPNTPWAPKLNGGNDYVIVCPNGVRNGDMTLSGDPANRPRNIVIIGCRSKGSLKVRYFTGVAHIEGTWWNPASASDGIDCGGDQATSGICRVQYTRITGLNGSVKGYHADCLQNWGPAGGWQVDHFTCDTNYQGIFLNPPQWAGFFDGSAINLSHNSIPNADGHQGVLFWFGNTDQYPNGTPVTPLPVTCVQCYAKVVSTMTMMQGGIYPQAGATLNKAPVSPQTQDSGRSACWLSPMKVNGAAPCHTIIAGDPAGGDFAPTSLASGY